MAADYFIIWRQLLVILIWSYGGSTSQARVLPDFHSNNTLKWIYANGECLEVWVEVTETVFVYFPCLEYFWFCRSMCWPLGNLNEILRHVIFKQILVIDGLRHLLWNCPHKNVIGLHWWLVNIGSGNGLVPSGNKSLTEPMLTQISVAIWRHWATMS